MIKLSELNIGIITNRVDHRSDMEYIEIKDLKDWAREWIKELEQQIRNKEKARLTLNDEDAGRRLKMGMLADEAIVIFLKEQILEEE